MANIEGIYRIQRVGRAIALIGVAFTFVGAVVVAVAWSSTRSPIHGQGVFIPTAMLGTAILFYLGLLPLILGATIQIIAWIWQGFLLPQIPNSRAPHNGLSRDSPVRNV